MQSLQTEYPRRIFADEELPDELVWPAVHRLEVFGPAEDAANDDVFADRLPAEFRPEAVALAHATAGTAGAVEFTLTVGGAVLLVRATEAAHEVRTPEAGPLATWYAAGAEVRVAAGALTATSAEPSPAAPKGLVVTLLGRWRKSW